MKLKYIGVIAFLIMLVPFVSAIEQNQHFNKIFLNPFYRQSMSPDIPYSYDITINPPAGITSVQSAIVTFQMWLNPTVEFFLEVNNQTCNTLSYEVHTTYASAGEGTIFFDCANIINSEGTYTVVLTPDDDTGAVTGWVDITYVDNQSDYVGTVGVVDTVGNVDSVSVVDSPPPILELLGTEYSPGDAATIFLQLKDAQGSPVSDGACYLDIYNPLFNGTHSYYLEDAPMIFDDNDDGLYYFDLITPDVLGNYMLAAKCAYSYSTPLWVYGPASQFVAIETQISDGTWSGSSQALNSKADGLYEKCESGSSTEGCLTTWQWTLPTGDYSENDSVVNVYYSGQGDNDELSSLSCLNITDGSYIPFTNQLTYSGGASEFSPTAIDDFLTNILLDDCINRSQTQPNITIQFYINKDKMNVYHNWLSLLVLAASGNIQDLKGSSEMHIADIPTASALLTAPQVWYFENRTITAAQDTFVGQTEYDIDEGVGKIVVRMVDVTGDPVIGADCIYGIFYPNNTAYIESANMTEHTGGAVDGIYYADFNLSGVIGVHPYGVDCTQGGKDYYILNTYHVRDIAQEVWEHNNRTLTNYSEQTISDFVWNNGNRTLTNYSEYSIADFVWNYPDRQLTYFNHTATAEAVWYWDGIIYGPLMNLFTDNIWNYTSGRYINGEVV